jgi:hypothetical protein
MKRYGKNANNKGTVIANGITGWSKLLVDIEINQHKDM